MNRYNLSMGEALIGDFAACGLTRKTYRTALRQLQDMGYVATKATNKGTIAKLIDLTIFDPNFESDVCVVTNNRACRINSNGQQKAANKKYKKYNNRNTNRLTEQEQLSPNMQSDNDHKTNTPTKKLSMYVLKGRKEAYEAELKHLRNRGSEYAMGFEYDSNDDRLRAIELKNQINETNRAMQNAV